MADLVLYDGVCVLCNRLCTFILRRDSYGRFLFASLQGSLGRDLLRRHGHDPSALDTLYVVTDYGGPHEALLNRGAALLHVLRYSGGFCNLAIVLRCLPGSWRDAGYTLIARRRYRWFGRYEVCETPPPQYRARFLD
jgi:predicted DCC family thiol-disulfide oxidoreductase YuxK